MSDLSAFKVGWIGTGVMGVSMCGHLIDGGAHATRLHPHAEARAGAPRQGRHVGRLAPAVAEASDVVFTIVGFPADVRAVFFGGDGVLVPARAGQVLVDMTTSEPSLAVEIAAGRGRT